MKRLIWAVFLMFALNTTGLQALNLAADSVQTHKTVVENTVYSGKKAIMVKEAADLIDADEDKLAVLKDVKFQDGEIEVWISGEPRKEAIEQARGFVGIAFRVSDDCSKFEAIYLRPTNGRADDQLRRNHSIQYMSYPDYPWHRLRRENPGKYESYADMEPGKWIKYRLVVKGTKAFLYLNENSQPNLIVNDLKLGSSTGSVGFWIGPGTIAHFSNLKIR